MQMVDDARVVVYLMTGFLESGKTSFLKQTIDKQYFKIDGTTVIILCEEGEEEYEEDLLARAKAKIVTVEDPEELDTRFSKFSPYKKTKQDTLHFDGADNIIDIFQKLYEETQKAASQGASSSNKEVKESGASRTSRSTEASESVSNTRKVSVNLIRLYTFHTLDDVIAAAHGLDGFYKGINTLYKDENSLYQLIVHQSSCTAEEFNKVCNILSEYGSGRAFTAAGEAHLKEHGELISRKALQQLAKI